jgi:hypothetical protein
MFKTVQKFCPTLLDTASLRILHQNIINFTLLNADYKRRKYPSARCTSATHAISGDNAIFNVKSVLINNLLAVDIFSKQIRTLKEKLRCGSVTDV